MTRPAPGNAASAAPVKVLHVTDSHLLEDPSQRFLGLDTAQTLQDVLDLARQGDWPPDLVLLTGDCVQRATPGAYARIRRMLAQLGLPCYCLPGNHDDPALMAAELNLDNVHYRRQILAGRWQIVMLDSSIPGDAAGCLAEREFLLLEELLSQQPNRYAVVVLHHQPVPVYSEWLDTMALPTENRDRLFHLLGRHRQVRLVLWGHVHQEYDGHSGNLRLLATPSTCFQFAPKSKEFSIDPTPPGCRWLYLYEDGRLDTRVQRLAQVPPGLDVKSVGY